MINGFRFTFTEENVTEAPRITNASGVAMSAILKTTLQDLEAA